ncbi:hypothetical protein LTS18_002863, partial [Coniosporium uncinatum]
RLPNGLYIQPPAQSQSSFFGGGGGGGVNSSSNSSGSGGSSQQKPQKQPKLKSGKSFWGLRSQSDSSAKLSKKESTMF